MDSRERVFRALEFRNPDRIPIDLWTLPATKNKYGKEFEDILLAHERDIISLVGPFDMGFTPAYYQRGTFMDPWGSVWTNINPGVIGEVKNPVIDDYGKLSGYCAPTEKFLAEWEQNKPNLKNQISCAREKGKFIIGGWISVFERLQFLRGTEELFCDIALGETPMFQMIEIMMGYMHAYLDSWLEMDIDGVAFGDDWGTQISLLISPGRWKEIFKPLYRELMEKIKKAGKKIFFHSDGYIFDLYPELIDLGVDAVNSQIWCMGVEKVADAYAGKITFWGEISRQNTLPAGTPEDVKKSADMMKKYLYVNGGGLIGQSEVGGDVPLENITAVLEAWND